MNMCDDSAVPERVAEYPPQSSAHHGIGPLCASSFGTMLVQISVMCAAYRLPGARVQPLHRPASSIGGRAMSLLMLQTEAPLRQALTT